MKYKSLRAQGEDHHRKRAKGKIRKIRKRAGGAFALCYEGDEITIPKVTFGREGDDLSQSHALFDALRRLDELGAKKVYARNPKLTGVGLAVYNRLIRAAAFCVIDLEKPFLIGLTGQTGAGKSYVAKKLQDMGYTIVDADLFSKN